VDTGTRKRLVDVALVLLTGGALAAGAVYWVAAEPLPQRIPTPDAYVQEEEQPQEEPIVSAREAVAAGLSVVQGNLLYEQLTLEGGEEASWMVPMKAGEDYIIDVLCVGSGEVVLELPGGSLTALPCDGSTGSTFLSAAGPTEVTLRRLTGDPVAVGIRVTDA
jgi:hypothetical protein